MAWRCSMARSVPWLFGALLVVALAGCSAKPGTGPLASLATPAPQKLALDREIAPVQFRWLSQDAVLIPPKVGERKLADFGNYVGRAAQKLNKLSLSVWDDESAWRASAKKSDDSDAVLKHKRAEYVKDTGGTERVDRYLVFDEAGDVIYQRDFRSYPISELD